MVRELTAARRGSVAGRFVARCSSVALAMLRPITRVHRAELGTLLLLSAAALLVMTASYLLKVAREPLVLGTLGAEMKSYSAALQTVLLIGLLRLHDWLGARAARWLLMAGLTLVLVALLGLFALLAWLELPVGGPFFVTVGIFNVFMMAQFWSLASDLYTREQGHRLFAVLGLGASLGAIGGARLAQWLFLPLGSAGLMLAAAVLLVGYLAVVRGVDRRHAAAPRPVAAEPDAPESLGAFAGLALLRQDRYLALVGVLTLLLNWVGTTGEYIFDRYLLDAAAAQAAGGTGLTVAEFVGTHRAVYFGWVNLISLALQMLVVSRLLQRFGPAKGLLALPAVSLGGYLALAAVPSLVVAGATRITESSISYSLASTARNALFLPTSRAAKYLAKATIDTLLWRLGDLLAAAGVAIGSLLALPVSHFVWLNTVLALSLFVVTLGVQVLYRRHTNETTVTAGGGAAIGTAAVGAEPALHRTADCALVGH